MNSILLRIRYTLLFSLMFLSVSSIVNAASVKLSVSTAMVTFGDGGGTSVVEISSNTIWSFNVNPSWCAATAAINNGDGTIVLTAQTNPSNQFRTAQLIVTAGNITKMVQIIQMPANRLRPDSTGMRNITSAALTKEMVIGWNLGNTMEGSGGETGWGNALTSQRLIDSVKAAGFNAVRIPVAFSKFSDTATFTIDTAWMSRVEQVVNYVLNDHMYAIINIHWDGGWMQPTYVRQAYVNSRLAIMWKQIAVRFRNYDDHLLFAGTNEVSVTNTYTTPTPENCAVQNGFNQTFVTAVRSTGGRNAYRDLVVQTYTTNIDWGINFFKAPTDNVDNKLIIEVHYYDPYNFTLNSSTSNIQWGKNATDPSKTDAWANEGHADDEFQKLKTNFIDKGYPVIMGEYAAMARLRLGSKTANAAYAAYRNYYMQYITNAAYSRGIIPFYWDSGATGNFGSGLFNRKTGAKVYPDVIKSITGK